MSDCIDGRFEQLLHAYELGMLSEQDRRDMEVHLLDCDSCWQKVQVFEPALRIMRSDPDIPSSIESLAQKHTKQAGSFLRSRRRWWPSVVPAVVVVAAVLVLVLRPWHVEIRPTEEAIAESDRLAVMYFDNIADPGDSLRLGEIVTNLVITDLAESQYLHVVSSQYLYDQLRVLGKEGARSINRDVATQVATKARARWMLLGTILQMQPEPVLTGQLVEVATGNIVASQRVMGEPGDRIFGAVDKLTAMVKTDLALPLASRNEPDRPVSEFTTHSAEAYRNYLEGVEYVGKFYYTESIASFRKAIAFDSTFAMAYYYLSTLMSGNDLDKAVAFIDRASNKDQFYIRALKDLRGGDTTAAIAEFEQLVARYPDDKAAYSNLGSLYSIRQIPQRAIAYFQKAIELDPFYKTAYNYLSYAYWAAGDTEKAFLTNSKYMELAPGEPNPYDSRAEIYSLTGNLDGAIEYYQKALKIKPDFSASLEGLARMYMIKGEYKKAEEYYRAYAGSDSVRQFSVRLYLAEIPMFYGDFKKALRMMNEAIATDTVRFAGAQQSFSMELRFLLKARILVELKDFAGAEEAFRQYSLTNPRGVLGSPIVPKNYYIQFLMETGRAAEARETAEKLRQHLGQEARPLDPYWFSMGYIEWAAGNLQKAVAFYDRVTWTVKDPYFQYWRGRAYLDAGQVEKAAAQFERILSIYGSLRGYFAYWCVRTHYYLGLAYEQSQWYEKAAQQYQAFIDYWGDSDAGSGEVADARARLSRLKSKT
jgi:tetratricopeptide (TPR) repeat protein